MRIKHQIRLGQEMPLDIVHPLENSTSFCQNKPQNPPHNKQNDTFNKKNISNVKYSEIKYNFVRINDK